MPDFVIAQIIIFASLQLGAYALGLAVRTFDIKVNYTRKALAFFVMMSAYLVHIFYSYEGTHLTGVINMAVFLLWMGSYCDFCRKRSVFLRTAFLAIDRPEDRPYTLLWFSTQTIAAYIVMVIMMWLLDFYSYSNLIVMTLFVSSIGDSLAEPVGVRFGRVKYKTKALFVDRIYERSYMGSFCVLLSGYVGVYLAGHSLSAVQYWIFFVILPPLLTLAEAKSPHTWDQPFIMLFGGVLTLLIVALF